MSVTSVLILPALQPDFYGPIKKTEIPSSGYRVTIRHAFDITGARLVVEQQL